MREDMVLMLAPAAMGILLMAYAGINIARIKCLQGAPRRVVERLLGEEAGPEEVEEELRELRRRIRRRGWDFLACSLFLGGLGALLGALVGPFTGWPALPGTAVFLFSLGMSCLALAGALG